METIPVRPRDEKRASRRTKATTAEERAEVAKGRSMTDLMREVMERDDALLRALAKR